MYDELVKRLRNRRICIQQLGTLNDYPLLGEAADAIEELTNDLARSKKWESFWEKEANEALRKFQLTVANKTHWIPVTERLPESVCKSYLCLTDTGYHCEVRWTNNVYGLWKSDNNWGWSIADVPQYCKVTHWMPLPTQPKGEEE